MIHHKIGEGKYTLYLKECPNCGSKKRKMGDKYITSGGIAIGGVATGLIFGSPLIGIFGGIGITKLALSGAITGVVAVQLIKYNYKLINDLAQRKDPFYKCPECGCTKLLP